MIMEIMAFMALRRNMSEALEKDTAYDPKHSVWLGSKQKLHLLRHERKQHWIDDYVDTETTVART
jgi:hypothetical protein